MEQNDRDHEVGAPAVESSNKPSELYPVVEDLKAVPGFTSGGNIDQGEENSGEDLKDKHDKGGAPENVKPARRIAWNGVLCGFTESLANLEARIQPIAYQSDQTHRRVSKVTSDDHFFWPGVGISPPLMNSFPSSIL
jgi:hypothetical protein